MKVTSVITNQFFKDHDARFPVSSKPVESNSNYAVSVCYVTWMIIITNCYQLTSLTDFLLKIQETDFVLCFLMYGLHYCIIWRCMHKCRSLYLCVGQISLLMNEKDAFTNKNNKSSTHTRSSEHHNKHTLKGKLCISASEQCRLNQTEVTNLTR